MKLKNKKIVFAGDSITDMNRGRNEIDLNHIYGHSFVFLLAGRFGIERPDDNITVINRGVSGDTSSDLLNRWNDDVLSQKPDIISLLIGINDIVTALQVGKDPDVNRYYANLFELHRLAAEICPEARFIVCEPFCFPDLTAEQYRPSYRKYIKEIQHAAQTFAQRTGSLFVPLQCAFDEYANNYSVGSDHWIWDGVHPTAAGHRIIENQWLKYAGYTDK